MLAAKLRWNSRTKPLGSRVPEKFKDCKFYEHRPNVTLMRTTVERNRNLGEEIHFNRHATSLTLPIAKGQPIDGVGLVREIRRIPK